MDELGIAIQVVFPNVLGFAGRDDPEDRGPGAPPLLHHRLQRRGLRAAEAPATGGSSAQALHALLGRRRRGPKELERAHDQLGLTGFNMIDNAARVGPAVAPRDPLGSPLGPGRGARHAVQLPHRRRRGGHRRGVARHQSEALPRHPLLHVLPEQLPDHLEPDLQRAARPLPDPEVRVGGERQSGGCPSCSRPSSTRWTRASPTAAT